MGTSLVNYIRELIGNTSGFWHHFQNQSSQGTYQWDYGMLFEYFIVGIIVCVVIVNVFKFLRALFT